MDNVRDTIIGELAAMQAEWDMLMQADKRRREIEPLWNRLIHAYEAVTPDMPSDASERFDLIDRAIRDRMLREGGDDAE